jgi:hypothetical protein
MGDPRQGYPRARGLEGVILKGIPPEIIMVALFLGRKGHPSGGGNQGFQASPALGKILNQGGFTPATDNRDALPVQIGKTALQGFHGIAIFPRTSNDFHSIFINMSSKNKEPQKPREGVKIRIIGGPFLNGGTLGSPLDPYPYFLYPNL